MTRPDFQLRIRAFFAPKYRKKEVVPMHATYGSRKRGGVAVPIFPCDSIISTPPEPEKIESERFPRCRGCPYPRHGLFCWTDAESCLRTEMDEIARKDRRRLEALPI